MELALYESVVAALLRSKTSDSTYADMALMSEKDDYNQRTDFYIIYIPSEYSSGYQPIPEWVFQSLVRDAGLVEVHLRGSDTYYARPGTII